MRVRKVRCPGCGAPKVTPSRTAYVYCDFCGRFMDWDFQIACQTAGSARPGPKYEWLLAELGPRLAAGRAAGDREALARDHRAIYAAHVAECPASYSPRVGDPAYLDAHLTRAVHAQVVRETDAACVAADAAVAASVKQLTWYRAGGPKVRAESFWAMYEAIVAAHEASIAALARAPHAVPDPDDTPPELSATMRDSIVVQGWLPYLDDATGEALLARTRLHTEYEDLPDPRLHERFCGHCGAPHPAPEGARRAICEACGHAIDLGTAARCSRCGGPIVFPLGLAATSCAHCHARSTLATPLSPV